LDLIEERKRRIIDTGSLESIIKLRYEDWHPIAKKLQSEGFMYTGASCQKKYINMKKSYLNNKKIVECKRAMATNSGKSSTEITQIYWPFFFRFATILDEVVDKEVVLKNRDPRNSKRKGDGDDEDDDEELEVTGRYSRKRRINTKHNVELSNAIHTLLKSEPVIILDDCAIGNEEANPENEYSSQFVPESGNKAVIKQESMSDETDNSALMRRLRRRKLQIEKSPDSESCEEPKQLPSKRLRKCRVRYSPDLDACANPSPEPEHEPLHVLTRTPKVKTFSLSSTTSDEVVTEIRHLRGDISRVNRNLENLVTSHNQLIDNFDKLFKFVCKRFK